MVARTITHELMGGQLNVYKRENSRFWQCSTYLNGRNHRVTTKEESLAHAKQFAEDWYLELRGKARAGLLKKREKTFAIAAEQFEAEYETITEGQRSPKWVDGHEARLRLHLNPFFGELGLSEVTPGKVQEYRVHRISNPRPHQPPVEPKPGEEEPPPPKPLARSTLHDEIVTLRQVLKTAIRHGWLSHLPDLSPPYRTRGKIVHRPWFSRAEYKTLYEAARAYAKECVGKAWQWDAEQVYDYILFMGNTGLRPDEAKNLQHRDVTIADDDATSERILEIEVRGKRGVGYCKSMPGAVRVYERLANRPKPRRRRLKKGEAPSTPELPGPMDHVFPGEHKKLFNGILDRANLKLDRDNKPRTAYSLRHTYICMRLMEGADIYQIAKNCRTSVEMIEKFYAAHIKNALDAAAINVLRPKPKPKWTKKRAAPERDVEPA
jgi:integrase